MGLATSLRQIKRGSRAPRVPAALSVESRTIGTAASYQLATLDVSKSGLLCSFEGDTHVPFIVNTILEIVIDPERTTLTTPLNCLAKVVRRVNDDKKSNVHASGELGIQILQMDQTDVTLWESCLAVLEQRFGRKPEPELIAI